MVHRVASTSFQRNTHLHLTARDKVPPWQTPSVANGKEREGDQPEKKIKGAGLKLLITYGHISNENKYAVG